MPNSSNIHIIYSGEEDNYLSGTPCMPLSAYKKKTFLHFHKVLEIGLCISGSGVSYIDNVEQLFTKGDITLIFPYQSHISIDTSEEKSEWLWIYIDLPTCFLKYPGRISATILDLYNSQMSVFGVISKQQYPEIYNTLYNLIAFRRNLQGVRSFDSAYLITALQMLILELATASKGLKKLSLNQNSKFKYIQPAINLIQNNNSDISEKALAKSCNISISTLKRQFNSLFCQSPKQYIRSYRIEKAASLLINTSQSILDIALEVGYMDNSGFYKAFKAVMNCSPKEYRNIYS